MVNEDKLMEAFELLDRVREEGDINPLAAGPLLQSELDIDRRDVRDVLLQWMESFGARHKSG